MHRIRAKSVNRLAAAVAMCLFFAAAAGATDLRLFVAPDGDDHARGSRGNPFATLTKARDTVRRLRKEGRLRGSVSIEMRAGDYFLDEPVGFTAEDASPTGASITVSAHRGEKVRLIGGRRLRQWAPVSDPMVLGRLPEPARKQVLVANLRAMGLRDFAGLTRRGYIGSSQPAPMELFVDGTPMTLARWPDAGRWARISEAPDSGRGGAFRVASARLQRWTHAEDPWVHGYWTWDWADSQEKVESIDPVTGTIATRAPHGVYGYKAGARFYAFNLLEELDQPGEYWIDRERGLAYVWPIDPSRIGSAMVSVNSSSLFRIDGAANLKFEGLDLEAGRGHGATIANSRNVTIAGCRIRNFGRYGVTIQGGAECRVVSCDIEGTGEGGIALSGGDRRTLRPAGHVAYNNDIQGFSRLCKTYTPGVRLEGVGNIVEHNRIHQSPHNAIQGAGNDHRIAYNEIDRVCLETGDAGAFYMGRDTTQRGNRIEFNHFHDLGAMVEGSDAFVGVMAVYLDDCLSGTRVLGNVFERAGRAVLIGGGHDNRVEGNLFIDCQPAVHVDSRGTGWAKFWFDGTDPYLLDRLKEVPYDRPPYTRYSGLERFLEEDPARPLGNRLSGNVFLGGKALELLDGLTPEFVGWSGNWISAAGSLQDGGKTASPRRDPAARLRRTVPTLPAGFAAPPVDRMGLVYDNWRKPAGRLRAPRRPG
ncbi:MAG: right-handed parallel beta-helix repeat-containing protein [Armatimonadota bacterium]